MAEALLELTNVETAYGRSQVLFGISFTISAGQLVTLMGRNGMGKTTTVRSIMGLTPARAGSIRFGTKDIRGLASYRVAKLGVGLVPEGRQIFPNLTVRENLIATAANTSGARDPWTYEKVVELFPRLAERAGSMGNLLSGGEQQMLAIGRALMSNPKFLMLDEPSLGLAPLLVKTIFEKIVEINRTHGITILLVEQNANLALEISHYGYVLETGRMILHDASPVLRQNPQVKSAYLGGV